MGHTALILGDQLSHGNPALEGADRVLVVESRAALARLRYHRQRRHLVLSSMRHFAAELRERGEHEVIERRDIDTLGEILGDYDDVVCAEPNSRPSRRALTRLGVRTVPSTQFLTDPDVFRTWASAQRGRLVMEPFYRDQRRRFSLLLDANGKPEGGRWNYDTENRRPAHDDLRAPDPWLPQEDDIDAEVRRDLDRMGLPEWGEDAPRQWAATAAEARRTLEDFVEHRLALFGPWQDAMVAEDRWLYHSRLSSSFNLWLLDPLEACRAAEAAYRAGRAPLTSVEGFIRQLIGWREYIWGMYWLRDGAAWKADNALEAQRPLPEAFWTGETDANCLATTVRDVRESAWANHIQRLMVLGNLMLLIGVEPWEGVEWFQTFIDGAEWVMAPNVVGMATYGDGGRMMTKPYAGSGAYIDRMSTYCGGCRYSPKVRTGPEACPVTALYWDFMATHAERFKPNRRMNGPLANLRRMDPALLRDMRTRAEAFRASLGPAAPAAHAAPARAL